MVSEEKVWLAPTVAPLSPSAAGAPSLSNQSQPSAPFPPLVYRKNDSSLSPCLLESDLFLVFLPHFLCSRCRCRRRRRRRRRRDLSSCRLSERGEFSGREGEGFGKEWEMASIIVGVLVFVFDLIALILAALAEQRRSTAQVVPDSQKDYTYCQYDSDIATGYGAGALVLLLVAQAIVMVVSRCFCCGGALKPGGARACALMLFLFSWLTFIIAEICLLAGSVQNAYHTRYRAIFKVEDLSCETLRKGVFAAGAAFIFFNAVITEFYYFCFSKTKKAAGDAPYNGTNIGMSPYK